MQKKIRSCAAEGINTLVIIPHHKKILMLLCQNLQAGKLRLIDILKLIHQNKFIFPLPILPHCRILAQKLIALRQHIVKIQFFMPFLIPFIRTIQLAKFLYRHSRGREAIRLLQFAVHQRKLRKELRNIFF